MKSLLLKIVPEFSSVLKNHLVYLATFISNIGPFIGYAQLRIDKLIKLKKMIKEILWEVPHIKLAYLEAGELCLIVENTELNDYVEDFLWDEYDFVITSVSVEPGSHTATYFNHLDANVSVKELIEMLQQLDINEVERIYKLNN